MMTPAARHQKTIRRSAIFLLTVGAIVVLVLMRLGRAEVESESAKKAAAGGSGPSSSSQSGGSAKEGASASEESASPLARMFAAVRSVAGGAEWWAPDAVPANPDDEVMDRWADQRRRDVLQAMAATSSSSFSGEEKAAAAAAVLFSNSWGNSSSSASAKNKKALKTRGPTTLSRREEAELRRFMLQHVRASEPWRRRHWLDYDVYKPIGFGGGADDATADAVPPSSSSNNKHSSKDSNKGRKSSKSSKRQLPWKKVFIAANLFNNEDLLGDFMASLTAFIERGLLGRTRSRLGGAASADLRGSSTRGGGDGEEEEETLHAGDWLRPEDVFVSIYSNANKDSTPHLLEHFAQPQLAAIGVGHHIVPQGAPSCSGLRMGGRATDGEAAGITTLDLSAALQEMKDEGGGEEEENNDGQQKTKKNSARRHPQPYSAATHGMRRYDRAYKKPKGISRIEWLGCLRNHALLPLLIHGKEGLFGGTRGKNASASAAPSLASASASSSSSPPSSIFNGLASAETLRPAFIKWLAAEEKKKKQTGANAEMDFGGNGADTHRRPVMGQKAASLIDYDAFMNDWLRDARSRRESARFRAKWRGGGKKKADSSIDVSATYANGDDTLPLAQCNHSFGLTGVLRQPYQNWWDPHSLAFRQSQLRYSQAVAAGGSAVCERGPIGPSDSASALDDALFARHAGGNSGRSLLSANSERTGEKATDDGVDESSSQHGGGADEDDDVLVLFFNDVYFYPWQINYLMATNTAVGTTKEKGGEEKKGNQQSDTAAAGSSSSAFSSSSAAAAGPSFDMACALDYYNNLYDTWVLRGLDGQPFTAYAPYAPVEPTVGPITDVRPILEEQRSRALNGGRPLPHFSPAEAEASAAPRMLTSASLIGKVLGYDGYYSQLKNAIARPTLRLAGDDESDNRGGTAPSGEGSHSAAAAAAAHSSAFRDGQRILSEVNDDKTVSGDVELAATRVDGILREMTDWVVRGSDGGTASTKRASSSSSVVLPALPVRSCWNGVVAIRGGLFLQRGLRFRFQHREELLYQGCWESECKYIGQDMATINMLGAMEGGTATSSTTKGALKIAPKSQLSDASASFPATGNEPFVLSPSRVVINPLVQISFEKSFFAMYQGEESADTAEALGDLGRRWGTEEHFSDGLKVEDGHDGGSDKAVAVKSKQRSRDIYNRPSSVFWWAKGYTYGSSDNDGNGNSGNGDGAEGSTGKSKGSALLGPFSGDTADKAAGTFSYTVLQYWPPPASAAGYGASSWNILPVGLRSFLSTPIRRLVRHFAASGLYFSLQRWLKIGSWLPGLAVGAAPPNPFFNPNYDGQTVKEKRQSVKVGAPLPSDTASEVLSLIVQVAASLGSHDTVRATLQRDLAASAAEGTEGTTVGKNGGSSTPHFADYRAFPNAVGLAPASHALDTAISSSFSLSSNASPLAAAAAAATTEQQLSIPSPLQKFVRMADPLVTGGILRPPSDAHLAPLIAPIDHELYRDLYGAASASGLIGQWWWRHYAAATGITVESEGKYKREDGPIFVAANAVAMGPAQEGLARAARRFHAEVKAAVTSSSSSETTDGTVAVLASKRLFFTAVRVLLTLKAQHGYDLETVLGDSLGVADPAPRDLRILRRSTGRGGGGAAFLGGAAGGAAISSALDPRAMFCFDSTDTVGLDTVVRYGLDLLLALLLAVVFVTVRRHAAQHHGHHFYEVPASSPFSPLVVMKHQAAAVSRSDSFSVATSGTDAAAQQQQRAMMLSSSSSPLAVFRGGFGLAIPATPTAGDAGNNAFPQQQQQQNQQQPPTAAVHPIILRLAPIAPLCIALQQCWNAATGAVAELLTAAPRVLCLRPLAARLSAADDIHTTLGGCGDVLAGAIRSGSAFAGVGGGVGVGGRRNGNGNGNGGGAAAPVRRLFGALRGMMVERKEDAKMV